MSKPEIESFRQRLRALETLFADIYSKLAALEEKLKQP